jgi:hypothetical protein
MDSVPDANAGLQAERWSAPLTPTPGGGEDEERQLFRELQRRLVPLYRQAFPDPHAPQTVVVVPGLTLDAAELSKLNGAAHYEERLLCLLMLLRRSRTHVVYVTSQPISPTVIDYYLNLLPGVPISHAKRRLTLLSCHDGSPTPLTQKILERPRLLERIRAAIPDPWLAHLTCFCATPLERTLAVRLGIPLYASDPELYYLGTKSGSREVFREAGVPLPDGYEHLRDAQDLADALTGLKRRHPALGRAVVKLNDGFSGESNASFSYAGAPIGSELSSWVRAELPRRLRFEAPDESWQGYARKLERMGGIAECFLEGEEVRSPSVQCRIDPLGGINIISTHDQVLAGPSGHVFVGCTFPADRTYAAEIQELSWPVAELLRQRGVLGRFGIDFVSRRRGTRWEHAAIEINLRKGGTTHPYLMLQFLTDGSYDPHTGLYHTPTGQPCFYYASDNLYDPAYRGLTPDDLIDIAVARGLHFHGATQQGVVFHLIGALSEHGKLGAVCIGSDRASAMRLYRTTIGVLDAEVGRGQAPQPDAISRKGAPQTSCDIPALTCASGALAGTPA